MVRGPVSSHTTPTSHKPYTLEIYWISKSISNSVLCFTPNHFSFLSHKLHIIIIFSTNPNSKVQFNYRVQAQSSLSSLPDLEFSVQTSDCIELTTVLHLQQLFVRYFLLVRHGDGSY
ncbi:hypothetical protein L1987_29931 [Smallanthus sonchifolius]|uniref:Uncharacterized protein n=1 Tax=Smallanthus sonchifolius TaxID=185202 RepID=A0ACB9I1F0_9ASTR|nr:hypothetical protein L1987_29931 [Smallanthus sonchifolius]